MQRVVQRVLEFPTEIVLVAALTIALLGVAAQGAWSLRHDWKYLAAWRAAQSRSDNYQASGERMVVSLGGISINGRARLVTAARGTRRYVAFVAHAVSLRGDISFWSSVDRLVPAKAQIAFVGYCDDLACIQKFHAGVANPKFPVIAFSEYTTDRLLLSADADHRAVVLDSTLVTLGSVRWTDQSSPAGVAAAIGNLR